MERETEILIEYVTCPKCKKTSITVHRPYDESVYHVYPRSVCKQFPEYIPEQIRKDYEEACDIAEISPRASATLLRRCLQAMIRDFWNITDKPNLYSEIEEVSNKLGITLNEKNALNALRQLGNIGAHPEKNLFDINIEVTEVYKMIKMIEILFRDWYIRRHEDEETMKEIDAINVAKQLQRKQGNGGTTVSQSSPQNP